MVAEGPGKNRAELLTTCIRVLPGKAEGMIGICGGIQKAGNGQNVKHDVMAVQPVQNLVRSLCAIGGGMDGILFCRFWCEQAFEISLMMACTHPGGVLYESAFGPIPAEFGTF